MKVFLSLLVFSTVGLAQTEFRGTVKGTTKPCSLQVQQIYYVDAVEKPENLRADVKASLQNDEHLASNAEEFFFTLRPASRANLFSGTAENKKDQLNVFTKAGAPAFKSVISYALKWWHVNHFHSAQCVNLKNVQE